LSPILAFSENINNKNNKATKRTAAETIDDIPEKQNKKDATSNGVIEVVFSFDTTGSMYACLSEVRRGIKDAIKRLKAEIPGRFFQYPSFFVDT
jgi:hypothetical protein